MAMAELHVAYVPVRRKGIKGQRMYKNSPFVIRKISDDQPLNVPLTIRFTGPETYTLRLMRML